ncbi:MAG TPA: TonB-dependent receptor, partial [Terriglobales bacterium]|nr:TonB-dependent receptor [Terriglobales bacterium]
MNTKLRYLAVLVAASLALVFCLPTFGQVLKASISGTLVDPQGAVVTGAQVKAKNMETGAVFTTATDSSGNFRLNLLPVGTYSIEISAQGFKTAARNSIATSAGQDSALGTLKMSLGEKSTTVEVSGEAPLIETTQAQISNTFSGQALNTFAGIQENEGLDRLALFVPGIASSRSNNFSNTNGASISSNGLRGRNNDQEIDGQNNNDNSVGGPGLFVSDPEFVQQYVIVTNQFGPEYGRNSGSVINIITKQGGNSWHGSVFGTEGSSYLNALSNTQKNTLRTLPTGKTVPFSGPPRSNDEFTGGTIGGPIMKNKAFLFFGFDNEILSALSVSSTTSLTPTPTGLATLGGCGAAINSSALALLQKFGPYAFGFGNPTPRPTGPKDPSGNPTFLTQTIGTCAGVQVGGVTRAVQAPFHGYDFVIRNDVQ